MSQQDNAPADAAPTVNLVALRRGHVIGRYEVVSILGQGGFGITYLARDAQLDREVAIKEYLPMALAVRHGGTEVLPRSTEVAQDFLWGRERFVTEGRTLASLSDAPAIVRVFDFLEMNGTAYLVMELLPGETLEHLLAREHRLDAAGLDRLLWPLLDGLERVHGAGFLHRDIKPANVLLRADGRPTLIDFGASRAAVAGRTTAMTAIFTPGYAAPEQMSTARQGPWTDIYGLAATLYHALSGKRPPSAFDRAMDDEYESALNFRDVGWPEPMLRAIDAGLKVRAAERPQSIAEWRSMLKGAPQAAPAARGHHATVMVRPGQSQAPAAPTPRSQAKPPQSPPAAAPQPELRPEARDQEQGQQRSRGKGALWAGLAVVLLAAGGGGYWFMSQPKPAAAPPTIAMSVPSQADRDRQAAEARQKVEQDAAQRRQIEDETRRKVESEMTEKQRAAEAQRSQGEAAAQQKAQEEARQKVAAESAAEQTAQRQKAEAETAEIAQRFQVVDRQRIQVALTALGFNTAGTDGTFGARTREAIAAWQKARTLPATGFLSGQQSQALLGEAAAAVTRFDDDQRRREAEEKAKAAAAAAQPAPAAATPAAPAVATPTAPAVPPRPAVAAAPSATSVDGRWQATYSCSNFRLSFALTISGGRGRTSILGDARSGFTSAVAVSVEGNSATFTRSFAEGGNSKSASLSGQASANQISAAGSEPGGGRNCQVSLSR